MTDQASHTVTATPQEAKPMSGFIGANTPSEEGLYKCVHCGFCLQACPTYVQTGLETESPRGRIALMKAVNEGRIGLDEKVYRHWDMCIQCRACEDVCPSGVPYGQLIEKVMIQVERKRKVSLVGRFLSWLLLGRVLIDQSLLTGIIGAIRIYQQSGLQTALRMSRLLRLIPGGISELERSLPRIPNAFFAAQGQVYHATGEPRASVALLSGCVMPLVHGPEMRTVTRVLNRNGVDVIVPQGQGCCGAIHTHVGDIDRTRELARTNIDSFLSIPVDAIVTSSAGCGTRMKEYGELFKDDPKYSDRAEELSRKVLDIHEFLNDLPIQPPKGRLDYTVTYQDACHLSHTQGIVSQPRALLESIPGLNLVEMKDSQLCCGAGGTYTLTQRKMSLRLLEDKMTAITNTDATVVATGNPGCMMQIQYGVDRAGLTVPVKYVTDLLDESYAAEKSVGTKSRATKEADDPESRWEEEHYELRSKWKSRAGDRRQRRDR